MRRWATAAVAAVGLAFATWLLLWHRAGLSHERVVQPRRLDANALKNDLAQRIQRAHALAPTPAPARAPRDAKSASSLRGKGRTPHLGTDMIEPQCILGPHELCTALAPLITACDGGDARACIAVGSYLSDTPPRPLIANVYFLQACRIGDDEGCQRLDDLKGEVPADCTADVFACAWRAYRAHDPAALDQACALGVADACAWMADATNSDAGASRAYFEAGCQLGSPMQCAELGHRLAPTCTPSDARLCYPPDAAQSAAALAMACAAGWGSDCAR